MSQLLVGTVTDTAGIRLVRVDTAYLVGNQIEEPPSRTEETVRTLRGARIRTFVESVEISANWRFVPNSNDQRLKTDWSQFGMYVGGVPFIRLEVDPTKGGHDRWLAAHIQVSGESSLLGHLLGLQGSKLRRLQSLHLPVGGFRYRPCLEDFLEFAIDEGLVPGRKGWAEVLNSTRDVYRRSQLFSLVRENPDVARDALGWDA